MGDLESDLAHVLITFEHARSGAHRKLRRRYCLQYCAYQPHFMPYVPFGIGGGQHHSDDMKDDEGSGPRRLRQDLAKALQAVQDAVPPGPRHLLVIDSSGDVRILTRDKHELAEELEIPIRDMRVVDPLVPLPYPADIMIRERAILINVEAIRMIITKDLAVVLSVPDPADYEGPMRWVFPTEKNYFVKDLVRRIKNLGSHEDLRTAAADGHGGALPSGPCHRKLPFELRVLEGALNGFVREVGAEISELVDRAVPAMDGLIRRVSRHELETVRAVKNHVEALLNRVQRIRKELEVLLDDDEDMADMYLTRRAEEEKKLHLRVDGQRHSAAERGELGLHIDALDGTTKKDASDPASGHEDHHVRPSPVHPHTIVDCENLLESYLMQAEYLLSRVMLLKEGIDDTEDLIQIELDQRRNELVALDLVITIVAAALGLVAAIAGICGMNLLPLPVQDSQTPFLAVTIGSCTAAVVSIALLLWYAYWKGLLVFIPNRF